MRVVIKDKSYTIRLIDSETAVVTSDDAEYVTTFRGPVPSCTCDSWKYRRRDCKHILKCREVFSAN